MRIAFVATVWSVCWQVSSGDVAFFVSPSGEDSATGAYETPFRTPMRARDAVRELKRKFGVPAGGVRIFFRGGTYPVTGTLALGAADAGAPGRPVVWSAWKDEIPTFDGTVAVPPLGPVLDTNAFVRIPEKARQYVRCANLKEIGFVGLADACPTCGRDASDKANRRPCTDLYADGRRLPVAMSPNEGWFRHFDGHGSNMTVRAELDGGDWTCWTREPDLMVMGYTTWCWTLLTAEVRDLDPVRKTFAFGGDLELTHQYKGPFIDNQAFRFKNALCALDSPGEWYIDKRTGMLYVWPTGGRLELSGFAGCFLRVDETHDIVFRGFVFRGGRDTGIAVWKSENVTFEKNEIRCFGRDGFWSERTRNLAVRDNVFETFGDRALVVSGGDRETLTESGNTVEHNMFADGANRKRCPLLQVGTRGRADCGTKVVGNVFQDTQGSAICAMSVDLLVMSNTIERCVLREDDEGAFDMGGDPTFLGLRIIGNKWRDIGCGRTDISCDGKLAAYGQAAIRLDDTISMAEIRGNIFEKCGGGGFGAVQINSGRRNVVADNVFSNCHVRISGRDSPYPGPLGAWKKAWKPGDGRTETLRRRIGSELYRMRYPGVETLPDEPYWYIDEGNVVFPAPCVVRPAMRRPRYVRGDENVRKMQPADEAAWIWMPGHELFGVAAYNDAWSAKDEKRGDDSRFFRFRNDFVSDGSPLRFDVSGDERFVLYMDGREIARGPQRGMVEHWYYQSYEIAGLASGPHRMEAVCWQLGAAAPLAQLSYRGGFLLKAEDVYDASLTTGRGKWNVAPLSGTIMTDCGTSQTFGVGRQCRVTGTGFPHEEPLADAWRPAVVVRGPVKVNPYGGRTIGWMLFPADRPDQMYESKTPGRVVNRKIDLTKPFTVPANAELDLWWDLGDYYCAYPELELSGGRGAVVTWGWTESLRDDKGEKGNRDEWIGKRFSQTFTDTFACDGRGDAFFTAPWWRCGRWCRVFVKTADSPLLVKRMAIGETRYPLAEEASFECGDQDVKRIVAMSRRTMEMCMHEMLFDCPYYEQQMYPGDTRIQLQILNTLARDARMNRFAISAYDWSRRDNGMAAMNFPSRGLQESSTYTMCWIMMCKDHLLWRDDMDFLRLRMPGVRNALMNLAVMEDADGLLENLPGWSFMDWVRGDQSFKTGVAPCGAHGEGTSALNNLQYLLALQSAAAVDAALGETHFAEHWNAKASRLGQAILSRFWDDARGVLADTEKKNCFSEHAQAMGLLSGILDGSMRESALKALMDGTGLAPASSYFAYYILEAFTACGRVDVVMSRLRRWRNYVDWGARTAFETQHANSRSDCHAWSACPIYFFHSSVAGVRPAVPCFRKVRIAPQPCGLKTIRSVTPCPQGGITCDLRFDGIEVKGTVTLPGTLCGDFLWRGKTKSLSAGVNRIDMK